MSTDDPNITANPDGSVTVQLSESVRCAGVDLEEVVIGRIRGRHLMATADMPDERRMYALAVAAGNFTEAALGDMCGEDVLRIAGVVGDFFDFGPRTGGGA